MKSKGNKMQKTILAVSSTELTEEQESEILMIIKDWIFGEKVIAWDNPLKVEQAIANNPELALKEKSVKVEVYFGNDIYMSEEQDINDLRDSIIRIINKAQTKIKEL